MYEWFLIIALFTGAFIILLFIVLEKHPSELFRNSRQKKGHLEDIVHSLKSTTLAMRTSRSSTPTFKAMWRVQNPFVSDSIELQLAYRRTLIKHMSKTDQRAWVDIASAVAGSLDPLLDWRLNSSGTCTIAANVRDISMLPSLAALMKALFNINDIPVEKSSYIAHEIHRITVEGKACSKGDSSKFLQDVQEPVGRLVECLCGLFSGVKAPTEVTERLLHTVSGTPEDFNPLDILLPAFEAPWRGVFYTMLAILQTGPQKPDYVLALRDCPADQSPTPMALAIIYESFRLYPPFRRVARPNPIDIESIQRSPVYWGEDVLKFHPERFLTENGQIRSSLIEPESSAWMPFALGSMKCPTARGYSVRLMVLVVGEILRKLFPGPGRPQWYLLGSEWDAAARRGDVLRAGREHYSTVDLVSYHA